MRFSTTALLALPLLAAAAESPFEQYKAKFQNFLSSFGALGPSADKAGAPAAAAPSAGTGKAKTKKVLEPKKIETLTLDNWNQTLYGPVKPDATQPEEWLVLISGRNKTCYGRCTKVEAAFNESATLFAGLPRAPHLGYLNCDDQPVLCNSWSANTGALWIFDVVPAPAPVEVYWKRLNLTTTTARDIVDAYANRAEQGVFRKYGADAYFHPFQGVLARYGAAVPIGYVLWALNAIPSWGMMVFISFISRTMMNRRMDGMNRQGNAAGGAPRAAPPGDARS